VELCVGPAEESRALELEHEEWLGKEVGLNAGPDILFLGKARSTNEMRGEPSRQDSSRSTHWNSRS
jgi:hypothetical protein